MKKERLTSIDGIRGISCLIIAFVYHYKEIYIDHFSFVIYGDKFVEVFWQYPVL